MCWLLTQKVSISKAKIYLFCDKKLVYLTTFKDIISQGTHITVKHFGSTPPTDGCYAVFLSPPAFWRNTISSMLLSIPRNQKERNVTGFSDCILVFAQVVQSKLNHGNLSPLRCIRQCIFKYHLGSSTVSPP